MKNKFILFIVLILFFLPISAHAEKILHTNVYTDQGNGTFHFSVATYLMGAWWSSGPFDVTTTNQIGTGPNKDVSESPPGYAPAYYFIEETAPADYQLNGIDCYCDNGYHTSGIFSYSGNRAYIYPTGDSSVNCSLNFYCDFYNKKIRTPVLIVPGLTGTNINKGSDKLWLDLDHNFTDIGDSFMDPLQFNTNLNPSDPAVTISNVITTAKLFGADVYDYTAGLISEFTNQGYVENQDLFMFPYDWRYGVSGKYVDGKTNADLLAQKIQDIMQQTGSSKVDIVAHSLGGLIVKKYAMDNLTSNYIGKAVFVGVPNTGAPKAVKALIEGDSFGIPWLSQNEMKKIASNMPAAYDLLPDQQYYNVAGSFVSQVDIGYGIGISEPTSKDLNYSEFKSYLNDKGLNSTAAANSENLHTANFDNFDLRTAGINLYAIDGCKAATMTNFLEVKSKDILGNQHTDYGSVRLKTGDNTVPLESATNLPIDQNNKYYALVSNHGKMPSEDGIRQEIVNLISGSNIPVSNNLITQDISKCQLNGKAISVFSPVDIFATDQNGNKLGLADDGSIINEIPNAAFEILGEHKFIYLPQDNGQTYNINLQGTGAGTYTIKSQNISNSQLAKAEVFSDLPVTSALTGQINFNSTDNTTTLSVKQNPTDTPVEILPTQVLDYSTDKTSPEAVIHFDPNIKDLAFSGTDNMSDIFSISIADNGSATILTDEAGNTTELGFKERNRRTAMSAEIKSIKYNGTAVDISRNLLSYSWAFDNSGKLSKLSQKVKARNNYSITAIYDGVNTKITGTTLAGKISQSFPGLKIIKITTNKGDLAWAY